MSPHTEYTESEHQAAAEDVQRPDGEGTNKTLFTFVLTCRLIYQNQHQFKQKIKDIEGFK